MPTLHTLDPATALHRWRTLQSICVSTSFLGALPPTPPDLQARLLTSVGLSFHIHKMGEQHLALSFSLCYAMLGGEPRSRTGALLHPKAYFQPAS